MSTTASKAKSHEVVGWESPSDPANPRNWNKATKLTHVALISVFTLYANLAALMFAPGAQHLVAEFGITSSFVATLTVSIYILGYVFGPFLLASMSEIYGRLPIYHICNTVYIGFTIGCALSTNSTMFLVFRFICGFTASGPMVVGGGTVADPYDVEERGKAIAMFGLGPLLGPVIGPVIGGFVAEYLGWRWTFWLILIIAGVVSLLAVPLMWETFEPVLLKRRAARLRKSTNNPNFHARFDNKNLTPRQSLARAIVRPIKLLFLSLIVFLLSIYGAFMFGLAYILFTTFPAVFEKQYDFGPGISGLLYLGLGVGMIISIGLFGMLSDKLLHQPRGGAVARPELRLILMIWSSPVVPIGFFWYGWSARCYNHWIVPILGTLVIGLGSLLILLPGQLYLVDAFGPESAASVLAVNTVLRSLFGAFLPLTGPPLYASLGLGWGNSVLAFFALAFVPVPFLFYKYGERLRAKFPVEL
ncbi:putative MFS transporter [Xylaria bambusicola]|uniref:putative MFS transporter n=1 Tax=Xylaria bambusicola TaxID=326684 RepID=UPI0020080B76|nr:putative MFS transporter [Xylaria bambusicola]KAI0506707.1 putative MFS transporter [Xylaria bambusicola]